DDSLAAIAHRRQGDDRRYRRVYQQDSPLVDRSLQEYIGRSQERRFAFASGRYGQPAIRRADTGGGGGAARDRRRRCSSDLGAEQDRHGFFGAGPTTQEPSRGRSLSGLGIDRCGNRSSVGFDRSSVGPRQRTISRQFFFLARKAARALAGTR